MATLAELWESPATGPNLAGLNPDLADRVAQASAAYQTQYGKPLPITSGIRTTEQQAALKAGGNRYPVAAPGTSKHEVGNAIDISSTVPESFLKQYGLYRPHGAKDPVHYEVDPKFQRTRTIGEQPTQTLASLWDVTPAAEGEVKPVGTTDTWKQRGAEFLTEIPRAGVIGAARKIFAPTAAGVADVALQAPGAIAGQAAYASSRASGRTPEQATEFAQTVQQAISPRPQAIGEITGQVGKAGYEAPAGAMQAIGETVQSVAQAVSNKTGLPVADVENMINTGLLAVPEARNLAKGGVGKAREVLRGYKQEFEAMQGAAPQAQAQFQAAKGEAPFASVGAAGATHEATVQNLISQLPPEMAQSVAQIPANAIDANVLNRHVEASSLPVPVRLTKGQATRDSAIIADEVNRRGEFPEIGQRFTEQNQQLADNLVAMRDKYAPDVYGTNPTENGAALIDAYKNIDNIRNIAIEKNYNDLKAAAGGDLGINARKLRNSVDKKLQDELLISDAQGLSQYKELQNFAKTGEMTFDNYLKMRRNLSKVSATATDGNIRAAARFMVEELDKLPLSKETAALKPLADAARASARERFVALEKDPAYKAAVLNKVAADDFINKFVINGKKANIQNMFAELEKMPEARQIMTAGVMNWLQGKSGITEGRGNFTQAGYNKALAHLSPKLNYLMPGEAAQQLKTLGNVAYYVQHQPKGAAISTSGTTAAGLREGAVRAAKTLGQKGLNVVQIPMTDIKLGDILAGYAETKAGKRFTKESLGPAAGARLSDIGKK